jgi:hypothetical protein
MSDDLLAQMVAPLVGLGLIACVILVLVRLWRGMLARRRALGVPASTSADHHDH